MPTFDTPTPISVSIDLVIGHARLTASDRTDTVVDVRPSDQSSEAVRAADQTRVDYSNGQLTIKTPKRHGSLGWFKKHGSIDVTVELPAGSRVHGGAAMGTLRGEGHLGSCRFKTAMGDITLDHTDGADVTTSSGEVRIAEIDGDAQIKNVNGNSWIGHVRGNVQLKAANGDIVVDRAGGDVSARTARGRVRIGEVTQGSVELNTASGQLEVGIPEGTAAWLDVSSSAGAVRNLLDAADGPEPTDRTVEVHARTYAGDVVIRRA